MANYRNKPKPFIKHIDTVTVFRFALLRLRSMIFTCKVTLMSSVIPSKLEFTVLVLDLGTPRSFSSVYLHSVSRQFFHSASEFL